jgi:hypothetical protein
MKEKEQSLSSTLKDVQKFFKDTKLAFQVATDNVSYCDKREQDILHELEIENLSYHEIAKKGVELKKVREARREAKNTVEIFRSLNTYLSDGKTVAILSQLKSVIGKTENMEKAIAKRKYKPRVSEEK